MNDHETPLSDDSVPRDVAEALGTASEAFEYVERARGHLYAFHQLMGRADLLFGDAVGNLRRAGLVADADSVEREIVGRNVLDGRWTFQIIEEFDDVYYEVARARVRSLEAEHAGGRRHVHEARMKEERRSAGVGGHDRRPAAVHPETPEGDHR